MKNQWCGKLAAALIAALALAGCGDVGGAGTDNFFYSNWSCGNQSQCIAVMGHNVGSAGPFCTETSCRSWNSTFIPGTSSCNASAIYPVYNSPAAGTCQN